MVMRTRLVPAIGSASRTTNRAADASATTSAGSLCRSSVEISSTNATNAMMPSAPTIANSQTIQWSRWLGGAGLGSADKGGAVDVDRRARRRGRRVHRKPAHRLGDLVHRRRPADRKVAERGDAAAAFDILLDHAGDGEAGADGEGVDALAGISAGDRLGHRPHAALRCGIMPVIGAVAAIGGAAGDVDDPPAAAARAEMEHGKAAKLGRGEQVDAQRPLPLHAPGVAPDRGGFEDAGIVDEGGGPALGP